MLLLQVILEILVAQKRHAMLRKVCQTTLTIQKSNERSWLPFSFHVGVDGDDDDSGDDKDKDNEQCVH